MFEQSLNSEDGKLETCQSPSHDVHMTAETEVEASVDNAESHGNSICKDNWQGFCLIESEPAYFNVMLADFGVKGIKVKELFSLDEFSLIELPKPVYGIVFLCRYKEEQEYYQNECPKNVWFANQIDPNACATVALINIVNNIPGLEIGETLASFKQFTGEFSPYLRGLTLGHFEFVKRIHNSFARDSDVVELDNEMKKEFEKSKRKKPTPSKQKRRYEEEEDTGEFHFSAYMPIGSNLWKLDGLDRYPVDLGLFRDCDWLSLICPMLTAKMLEYEDQGIEFNILALVKDPLDDYKSEFVERLKLINAIDNKIDILNGTKPEKLTQLGDLETNKLDELNISQKEARLSDAPGYLERTVGEQNDKVVLSQTKKESEERLQYLETAIRELQKSAEADLEKAADRRNDYTPAIHQYLSFLAENQTLSESSHDLEFLLKEHTYDE